MKFITKITTIIKDLKYGLDMRVMFANYDYGATRDGGVLSVCIVATAWRGGADGGGGILSGLNPISIYVYKAILQTI